MLQEGYVIPGWEIKDDIRSITKVESFELPRMDDVLGLASEFRNVELVESLLAAGADSSRIDPDYFANTSPSEPPPSRPEAFWNDSSQPRYTSPRRDETYADWYCHNCGFGPNGIVNTYCPSCRHRRIPRDQ